MARDVPFPKRLRLPHEYYANRELVFHVTVATHPAVTRLGDRVMDSVWADVMSQRTGGRIELLAACLMPDHLHLLLKPDGLDLLAFENAWKSWSTHVARNAGHQGPLWQPGMWDRTIRSDEDLVGVAEYIIRNPVVAGLAEQPEEWPYSWVWYWDDTVLSGGA